MTDFGRLRPPPLTRLGRKPEHSHRQVGTDLTRMTNNRMEQVQPHTADQAEHGKQGSAARSESGSAGNRNQAERNVQGQPGRAESGTSANRKRTARPSLGLSQ